MKNSLLASSYLAMEVLAVAACLAAGAGQRSGMEAVDLPVAVRDFEGDALPGALVYLCEAAEDSERAPARSDDSCRVELAKADGSVVFAIEEGVKYSVTAMLEGFTDATLFPVSFRGNAEQRTPQAVTLALHLAVLPCFRGHHLQPSESVFAEFQDALDYRLALRKVLVPEEVDHAEFSAVVIPAFTPEWSLFLYTDASGRRRMIELRVLDAEMTQALASGAKLPGVDIYKGSIDEDIAAEVVAALVKNLRRTAYPEPPNGCVGVDGVGYHFSGFLYGEGTLSGFVWSPESSSGPGKLVELLEALRLFAQSPQEDRPARELAIERAAQEALRSQE